MTRMDPHIHVGGSSCSQIPDDFVTGFFLGRNDYVPIVTDHMSVQWYKDRAELFGDRVLYGLEFSVNESDAPTMDAWTRGAYYDILLISYDPDALAPLFERKLWRFEAPPVDVLQDPRVLFIWAHPEYPLPWWMKERQPDFLEVNAARTNFFGTEFLRGLWSIAAEYELEFDEYPRLIVGSDSHNQERLGLTFVEFDTPVRTGREAFELLKAGRFTNVLNREKNTFGFGPNLVRQEVWFRPEADYESVVDALAPSVRGWLERQLRTQHDEAADSLIGWPDDEPDDTQPWYLRGDPDEVEVVDDTTDLDLTGLAVEVDDEVLQRLQSASALDDITSELGVTVGADREGTENAVTGTSV